MGDGYCKHCDDDDNPQISRDFLEQVFRSVRKRDLVRFEALLTEDIQGNCDACRAETSCILLTVSPGHQNYRCFGCDARGG
jgi:hypothetical protein